MGPMSQLKIKLVLYVYVIVIKVNDTFQHLSPHPDTQANEEKVS